MGGRRRRGVGAVVASEGAVVASEGAVVASEGAVDGTEGAVDGTEGAVDEGHRRIIISGNRISPPTPDRRMGRSTADSTPAPTEGASAPASATGA